MAPVLRNKSSTIRVFHVEATATTMTPVQIEAIGLANPPRRFSQDEAFQMAGYTSPRILQIFRNCDIDFRHFFLEPSQSSVETPSDLNNRYLKGAMETGCRAIAGCLQAARNTVSDIDLLVV